MGVYPLSDENLSTDDQDSMNNLQYQNFDHNMFAQQPQDLRVTNQKMYSASSSNQSYPSYRSVGYEMSIRGQYQRTHPYQMPINPSRNKKQQSFDRSRKKQSSRSADLRASTSDPQFQRAQANNRERQRTLQLNAHFSTLKRTIPFMPSDKMSKIQTLRFAMDYIQFLNSVLIHGLEITISDAPESWTSSKYLTHELLSKEFLFRRMQNAWANQRMQA